MQYKQSILFQILILFVLSSGLLGCQSPSPLQVSSTFPPLQFSGERAAALEKQFVHQFPLRASGQPNSPRAAAWLKGQLIKKGWKCQIDSWEVVNYSKPVTLRNVVAMLPGKSTREIVVMAHHDQSPATVEGADNDGSGISLLLHLSEIFGTEQPLPYTLVFVATDGEEGQVLIMV